MHCLKKKMSETPSVRSAYSNLVSVLAKCFPANCAHLKKLPRTEHILRDWQVLVGNAKVAERDVELFHTPPLSGLGLSRLLKEGKLTPKSQVNIWGYVDLVLEAMQPPPVEVPSPADMRLMRSVLSGRADDAPAQEGGLNLGNLAFLVKDRLRGNPELAQMIGGLLGGEGGDVLSTVNQLKESVGSDPSFQKLFTGEDPHEGIEKLGRFMQDKLSDGDFAGKLKGFADLFANGGKLEGMDQNFLGILPENLKAKFEAFGEEVKGRDGDHVANALSLMTSHFDGGDFEEVANALMPHIETLFPDSEEE